MLPSISRPVPARLQPMSIQRPASLLHSVRMRETPHEGCGETHLYQVDTAARQPRSTLSRK